MINDIHVCIFDLLTILYIDTFLPCKKNIVDNEINNWKES